MVATTLGIASHAATIVGEGVSIGLLGVSRIIGENVQKLRVNRQSAMALSARIHDYVAIITTTMDNQPTIAESDPWRRAFQDFSSALDDVNEAVEKSQRRSYIVQLLNGDSNADDLRRFSEKVQASYSVLMLQANMKLHCDVAAFQDARAIAMESIPTLVTLPKPSLAFEDSVKLPPFPQHYFGRAAETQTVVRMITGATPSYIAILGGPGMGKTSLSLAILHDPDVIAQFGSHRFFVACDAAEGFSTLMRTICTSFGITAASRQASQKELVRLIGASRSVLVLDNLESAWEPPVSRKEAEETLSFLSGIEHLSLIITMRGSERPSGLIWTKPFLPTLSPLDDKAAMQLFVSISDTGDDDDNLPKLLASLGNVPLAVTLMAYLAQYQSVQVLSARWDELKTTMLTRSHGANKMTSLDVSIELSLDSPRMQRLAGTTMLLSLLSLLPQGSDDCDIELWASELSSPFRPTLSSLLQTSLAHRTPANRIYVLAPIREYMISHHAPGDAASLLYSHYYALAEIVAGDDALAAPDSISAVLSEVDNIYSVIVYGFEHLQDPCPAVKAAVSMVLLFCRVGIGSFDLLPRTLDIARRAHLDDYAADLLFRWAGLAEDSPRINGDAKQLASEAQTLYRSTGNTGGIIDATLILTHYLSTEEAIASCTEMRDLAESIPDFRRVALVSHHLAVCFEGAGRKSDALAARQRAVNALRPLADSQGALLGILLYRVAPYHADAGDVDTAISQLKESIALMEAGHRRAAIADAKTYLATFLWHQGYSSTTVELLNEALIEYHASGRTRGQVWALQKLVAALLDIGNVTEAIEALEKFEQGIQTSGIEVKNYDRATLLFAKADLARWRGDFADARVALRAARNLRSMRCFEGDMVELSGRIEQEDSHSDKAHIFYLLATLVYRDEASQPQIASTLVRLAQVSDDHTSEKLLGAAMLPLLRYGFRPTFAEALLHSASIALRQGQRQVAVHRARSALRYVDTTRSGCERANAFLERWELFTDGSTL